jgi:alanyl-tRNA synthetase
VSHVNFISNSLKEKGADARTWATKVNEVLGGKVKQIFFLLCIIPYLICGIQAGGKDDSAQGTGIHVDRLGEAIEVAQNYLTTL